MKVFFFFFFYTHGLLVNAWGQEVTCVFYELRSHIAFKLEHTFSRVGFDALLECFNLSLKQECNWSLGEYGDDITWNKMACWIVTAQVWHRQKMCCKHQREWQLCDTLLSGGFILISSVHPDLHDTCRPAVYLYDVMILDVCDRSGISCAAGEEIRVQSSCSSIWN